MKLIYEQQYYFTGDGSYGQADQVQVLDMDFVTPQEWKWIEQATDSDRIRMAITAFVRSFYRERDGIGERGLPCQHCHFVSDDTTESGFVWITCDADTQDNDPNGCDWGNR